MEHDPLSTLLQQADVAQPAPAAPPDLATRVRHAARRRRHRRRAAGAASLAALVIGATVALRSPRPVIDRPPTVAVDVDELRREYARLTADAELHEQTAALIEARERARTTAAARPDDIDPAAALAADTERAALILLRRGERLLAEPDAKTQAADAFRRIVAHFPQSRGAVAAQEHLDRIGA